MSEERCCGKPSIACDARPRLPVSALWGWGPYPGPDTPPAVLDALLTTPLLRAETWTHGENDDDDNGVCSWC